MIADAAPLFVLWERLAGEVLTRTQGMPKAQRFTFAQRIDNLALDILEALAGAHYSKGAAKRRRLEEADERLLRLRVLVRLAYTQRLLDHGAYEQLARGFDEAGRMLGGWRRQQAEAGAG